jgi:ribonuclease HIII
VNFEDQAKKEMQDCRILLKNNGYDTFLTQRGNYCYETTITVQNEKIKLLVYFGKKGIKKVLQGNRDLEIFKDINKILFDELPFESEEFKEPDEYIGTDESGKGDFFGPLIIAGVFVSNKTKKQLKELGVRDSKLIAHNSIKFLASDIKKIIGKDSFNIVIINPSKYNDLYQKFGNLNKLLAWGHAKVLENILNNINVNEAISDKFGDEKLIRAALQEKGKSLELYQFHKAEKYVAVAAASIVARDKFNDWFSRMKKELMLELPKGASGKVIETAKLIKEKYNEDFLRGLTKTHFKTSRLL